MSYKSKLAAQILSKAREQNLTLSTAESCTGGWIGKTLTDPAGASDVFTGAMVSYANSAKMSMLGVTPTQLSHGAVSEQVATAMAEGARDALGTDYALSVTGIAGPAGGSPNKPVGTVWFALAREGHPTQAICQEFGNKGRNAVRKLAVIYGLEWIDSMLSGATDA